VSYVRAIGADEAPPPLPPEPSAPAADAEKLRILTLQAWAAGMLASRGCKPIAVDGSLSSGETCAAVEYLRSLGITNPSAEGELCPVTARIAMVRYSCDGGAKKIEAEGTIGLTELAVAAVVIGGGILGLFYIANRKGRGK
jgi:hypothetical protein